jgi:hypothetical protein
VGYESSRAARRRLAAVAATNQRVQEALSPSAFPGFFGDDHADTLFFNEAAPETASLEARGAALNEQLDLLAQDIVATPGAGGALLAAFAAQARALTMVVEAARRSAGTPLPISVLLAAEAALSSPTGLQGLPHL